MDIIIKCLAVIGAVSILGSLVLAFLSLRFAKKKSTTYPSVAGYEATSYSHLDSNTQPHVSEVVAFDLDRRCKGDLFASKPELTRRSS
jgi:hypothetical protein